MLRNQKLIFYFVRRKKMIDAIMAVLAFVGLTTIVFVVVIWLCAYWATSSTFIGSMKRRKDND